MVMKFERTFSLVDIPVPVRQRTGRSLENIEAVRLSVQNEANQSIPRRAQELGISQTTLWRILTKNLHLHPYKIKLTQELKPLDHLKRRNFSDFALQQFEDDPEFHQKIFFSDEAHFWMNGFVNKQNMRYWSATNPHVLHETALHSQKVSVWCAFHAGGVIWPYFFVDENNRHVTVNGVRYRAMLEEYFWPELDGFDIGDMWFQQDGDTSHTAGQTIDLLKTKFGNRLISRNGPVEWPPRSCDLTPLNFFLWGYLKSKVYANHPRTLDDLKNNIQHEITNIPADMCGRVVENCIQRIECCRRACGGHTNDIEFHT